MDKCSYCGKEVSDNSVLQADGHSFCDNLCRRSFERNGGKAKERVIPVVPKSTEPTTPAPHIVTGESMPYKVNAKENGYLALKVIFTVALIVALVVFLKGAKKAELAVVGVFAMYAGMIALFFFVRNGLLIGFLRGACVRVTSTQFPDIYAIIEEHSQKLGLHKAPPVYVMQAGGLLNAFATRFIGKDYVVILSDVLDAAYSEGKDAVSFIIGHELGHVKRGHMTKNFLLFPSILIPFLQGAYSRACEFTCDSIGHSLSPTGSTKGMLILSVGKSLHGRVDVGSYLADCAQQGGFWVWFSEICSSHPFYPKRILQFNEPK